MLVGTRLAKTRDVSEFDREITEIKRFYGIREQRLETLLNSSREEHDAVQRHNAG